MLRIISVLAAAAVTTIIAPTAALAHEERQVGDYQFVVGFLDEPAYEGERNAVSLRVTKAREEDHSGDDHGAEDDDSTCTDMDSEDDDHDDGHEVEMVPVEGIESTLRVEVTHVASGVSKTMNLRAVFGEPGHYAADLIPTSPGHYRFRFVGSIDGEAIDATYDSRSGGGDFDDVQVASAIHFPEPVSSSRELESVVRGGQTATQQAQDAAVRAEDSASSASTLGLIGVVLGVIGTAVGSGAVVIAIRGRNR